MAGNDRATLGAGGNYMTAEKFLKIFDKVQGMIPISVDTEIRVEYGDENFFPSTYQVRSVTRDRDATRVLLESPATTCKARGGRAAIPRTADSCCTATTQSCCAV
jgi:hypothetical protein